MQQSQRMLIIVSVVVVLAGSFAAGVWVGRRAYYARLRRGPKTMREFLRERGTEWYFQKRLPPE